MAFELNKESIACKECPFPGKQPSEMALLLFPEVALFMIAVDVRFSGVRSPYHGWGAPVEDAQGAQ